METVDLCQSDDESHWAMFRQILREAQTGGDRNADNYADLYEKVRFHDAFHILVEENKAIAFAGLYNNGIYPTSLARVLNRAYYAKSVRQSGLPTNKDKRQNGGLLAKHILPLQIEIARIEREAVFFSVEFNRRRRTIKAVTDWINRYNRTYPEKWEAMEGMYLTCPRKDSCLADPSCWQNVSVLRLCDDYVFALQKKTREEWDLAFGR